ncbi:unnamed protein product [Triticum turgidum subsp. durum]|uniref:Uncharacterized protein n=1 Tax=Triticum turgidum subsp. durum TaxID=4567 RepID=A0A9R1NY79_TRITD|nr:unnamed protein product [Triticum turgidum subsp. durum]
MHCLACAAPAAAAAARAPGRRFGRRRVVVDCIASADRNVEGTPPRLRETCELSEISSKTLLFASKRKILAFSAFCLCLHSSSTCFG